MIERLKIIFVPTFLLNFIWEILHRGLYSKILAGPVTIPFVILGSLLDVLIVWVIFSIADKLTHSTLKKLITVAFLGMLAGSINEKAALFLHIWTYNPKMPIVPLLGIGLTPFLQMIILPPIIYLITIKLRPSSI